MAFATERYKNLAKSLHHGYIFGFIGIIYKEPSGANSVSDIALCNKFSFYIFMGCIFSSL
jgi:hypothetical protein